ncbi:uncharacterized protein LY79DRAFT_536177 [Colletotrichum navitas]|uniref:Uncharacterized protein n=1 Tax=Colletotrichum navitas TaxID=681940 RepID=A0AAD8QED7_9PEZI|nr:uncharacterized protein LY79DRAFT_536177 [Colletotrichum navitas]KAK1599818.1 hypothetical protein LY79DRAFT_536177 [Colletotrichum navitas]
MCCKSQYPSVWLLMFPQSTGHILPDLVASTHAHMLAPRIPLNGGEQTGLAHSRQAKQAVTCLVRPVEQLYVYIGTGTFSTATGSH